MTSFKISLWGGLPPPIKEDVAVGTFLARPSMAEGHGVAAPAQTFFAQLSTCRTTGHLYDKIYMHLRHPANAMHPFRCFNPSEYRITEIVVLKRRVFIQHEGFMLRVHHEPPAHHPAEPDFIISIDRSIDSMRSSSFISSPKLAIDRVGCSLLPIVGQLEGSFGRPIVWRMPAPGHQYAFNLNLAQFGVLLHAVLFSYPQQQYSTLYNNCFSHSRILRAVIIRIIQAQQPQNSNNPVIADELNVSMLRPGTCFGFSLDRNEGEDEVVFGNYQALYAQFLS